MIGLLKTFAWIWVASLVILLIGSALGWKASGPPDGCGYFEKRDGATLPHECR